MLIEKLLDDIEFNKEVLNGDDEEMREMAKVETWHRLRKTRTIGESNFAQHANTQRPAG